MFEKDIAERLGIKMTDLPPYIGMRGRTPEYYIEKLRGPAASDRRKAG